MEYSIINLNEKQKINTVYCVARNYVAHAKELHNEKPKEPVVFIKATSCINPDGSRLVLPEDGSEIHYEGELVIALGEDLENIDEKRAEESIYAYGLGIDYTNRTVQNQLKAKGLPWTTAKNFYGSAPISDFVLKDQKTDLQKIHFFLSVNNEIRQEGYTGDMIFGIAYLISFLSKLFPLRKGDLIFTGTPAGVGKVEKGDQLKLWMDSHIELFSEVI